VTGVFTALDGSTNDFTDDLTAMVETHPTGLYLRESPEMMLTERHQGTWKLELRTDLTLILAVRVTITAGCQLDRHVVTRTETDGGVLHLWPGLMTDWIRLGLEPETVGLTATSSAFSCSRYDFSKVTNFTFVSDKGPLDLNLVSISSELTKFSLNAIES